MCLYSFHFLKPNAICATQEKDHTHIEVYYIPNFNTLETTDVLTCTVRCSYILPALSVHLNISDLSF